jgi:cytochrome c oxidase cbb3-type subunit III
MTRALITVLAVCACQREHRSFVEAASRTRPQLAPAQGDLVAGGDPRIDGDTLDPTMPGYSETAQSVSEGRVLYQRMNCVGCHHYGGGGIGPALMDETWRYGRAPGDIATSIIAGRRDGMPSYRGKLTAVEVGELVSYVRSLADLVPTDRLQSRDEHIRLGSAPTLNDLAVPHGAKSP